MSVITVDNLGKRYLLSHQGRQGSYVALRDVFSAGLRNMGRRLLGADGRRGSGLEPEEFWALKDVSFEVKQGDRVGIIGRNGAGKSTLLKILSRIVEPSSGSVRIRGRVASLLEVGTGFHPELTGRENIYLNGAILGMSRSEIRSKFDEIVDFAEIEKFLDTPVKRYSSGMYVRLAFAVAANLDPEILIVDEVLAVGDLQFQKKCMGKMQETSNSGRTLLFVSHNMGAINELCDRCIYLQGGSIRFAGDTREAIDRYVSLPEETLLTACRTFQADTVTPVQVTELRLENSDGGPCTEVELGEDCFLYIRYEVLREVNSAVVALLLSRDGVPLLYSYDVDCDQQLVGQRKPGSYLARVRMPVSLLKEGLCEVRIMIGAGNENLSKKDVSLSFEIVNNRVDTSHLSYRKDRPGILYKTLPWEFLDAG